MSRGPVFEIIAASHDAEHAAQPLITQCVGVVRRLACAPYLCEHVCGGKRMDGKRRNEGRSF